MRAEEVPGAISGEERSERRDASRHLARVQELGDRLDDELRLVHLLDMRGARYEHERPRGGDGVDHLSR